MVRTVYEMDDGRILVANTGGVVVIKDGKVIKTYSEPEGIENTEILTVTEGADGDIICGTDGGGIFIVSSEGVKRIGRKEGLSSESVMRIKRDRLREMYWIVTGTSLAYLTADYELHTVDRFPYSNNFDLYENSKGDMWVLSSNGIYIVSADELIQNKDIDPIYYGISDGLPCIATANSYSEVTGDGDMYIAGSTGVAKLNMENSFEGYGKLKAAVPYLEADGEMIHPDESGDFVISPDVRKLTIYAYVYNYSLIDPFVTYKLEGFDQESIKLRRSELGAIDYTNLSGRDYEFVMEIKDSIHSEANKLSVSIRKKKAFFEYPWFYIVSGALALLLLGILVRLYVKKKMRVMEEKNREQAEKERIATELDMAKKIQKSALPGETPVFPDRYGFDICASMDPAREVGGDFYDYFMIDDDHLCMIIADVSGKGIPAALFMMNVKSTLKSFAMLYNSPSEILEKTNEDVCSSNNMGMFVTVWLGILELSTGKLTTANAGHEYPALKRKGGRFELVKTKHGLVLGGISGIKYKENEVYLKPGDRLFLYTDGVTEAIDSKQDLFGTDRMTDALNRDPDGSLHELLSGMREAVDAFVKEEEQFDDLTMMCMDYKGSG